MFVMQDAGDVRCSGCEMFEMWNVWNGEYSGCDMFVLWTVWDVGCGVWDVWGDGENLDLQNARKM